MWDSISNVDWHRILVPDTPLVETIARGSLVYLILFGLLRFILKRERGTLGITDLLLVVLIAEGAQNALADDYTSIPDGVLLVATIIFWSHALNWLGFRFPRLQRLLRPPPLPLVKNGTLLYRNMRQELITKDELMSQVRREGLDDLADVETAYMEGDGRISVIARKGVQTMPASRAPVGGMDGVGESRGRA